MNIVKAYKVRKCGVCGVAIFEGTKYAYYAGGGVRKDFCLACFEAGKGRRMGRPPKTRATDQEGGVEATPAGSGSEKELAPVFTQAKEFAEYVRRAAQVLEEVALLGERLKSLEGETTRFHEVSGLMVAALTSAVDARTIRDAIFAQAYEDQINPRLRTECRRIFQERCAPALNRDCSSEERAKHGKQVRGTFAADKRTASGTGAGGQGTGEGAQVAAQGNTANGPAGKEGAGKPCAARGKTGAAGGGAKGKGAKKRTAGAARVRV